MMDRTTRPGGTSQARPMGGWGPMSGFGVPVEKPKNVRGTLIRLLGYFKPMRYQLVAVLVAAVLGTVFNVVGPKVLGLATTELFEGILAKSQGTGSVDFVYNGHIMLVLAVL